MVCLTLQISAQQKPAEKQSKSVLILNATAHLGNGKVVEKSLVGFKDGKLSVVADATISKIDLSAFDIKIDAFGKHVYPGFIAPN
jgi:N-acyl-D-aspartate/D-glutamate deacylase